ncbi:hypothetical protein EP7_004336 [Isosphaeraceae bacterium EP7]
MEDETKVEEKKVVVYELEKMLDETLRIGNSIEVPQSEAIRMVDQKKAKFPDHPIGVIPEELT